MASVLFGLALAALGPITSRDIIAICVVVGAILLIILIALFAARDVIGWRFSRPVFSMQDLQKLRQDGEISKEEYQQTCIAIAKRNFRPVKKRPASKQLKFPRYRSCPACGYDLRATPERCPGCVTVTIKKPTSSDGAN